MTRPVPTTIKILQGTLDRAAPNRPKPPPLAPAMPRWPALFGPGPDSKELCRDAARLWRSLVPELERAGIIGRLDGTLLSEICTCWARLRLCERKLTAEGMVVVAAGRADRGVVKSPYNTLAGQLRQSLQRYISELGMTPAARERLTTKPVEADDPNNPFDV